MRAGFLRLLSGGVLAGMTVACWSTLDDVCDLPHKCDPLPDASPDASVEDGSVGAGDAMDAATDTTVPPPGCSVTADPKDAPACVIDEVGIFVDAARGNDTNAGTKAAPVKTIAHAISKTGTKKRIYVCEGTYAENVSLDESQDGVSVYGGFACGADPSPRGRGNLARMARPAPTTRAQALHPEMRTAA